MKKCSKCYKSKEIDNFPKQTRNKNLFLSYCKECNIIIIKRWQLANKDKLSKNSEKYYINNIEKIKVQQKLYYYKNKAKRRENAKKWAKLNSDKVNCNEAKRRASKSQRTPKWLTELQLDNIKLFYEAATHMTKETGIHFAVDHIIPLHGEIVSGLHVPWNLQVLTKSENSIKLNKLIEK